MSTKQSEALRNTAIILVLFAAITRFIPHPYNFTAIGAMALFAGSVISDRRISYLLPLITMGLTDLYFGLHFSILPVYLCFLFTVWIGTKTSSGNALKIVFSSLVSSVVFFLVTNLPFWYADLSMYSLDLKGTMESYTMALPFFGNQIAGDLIYTGLLFGSYALVRKNVLKTAPVNS